MLPRLSFRLLAAAEVATGWLVRRTPDAVAFLATDRAANGRPKLRPDQLASPPQRLPEGLSVNLLGQFRLADAAWVPATDTGRAYLREYWQPDPALAVPAPLAIRHMQATPLHEWDAYALAVAEVEGYALTTTRGTFVLHMQHAPTGWNYWHCELRFRHTTDGWADAPGTYSANQLRKVGEAIRQSFQEAGLAQPLAAVGTPLPWPPPLFDTAAPTQP
ncbi:MAG: hypothetical protein ACRYG7_11385 [Janthinobacterium lividum]